MLRTMTFIVSGLLVYPERMLHNMELTRGLAYSGQLLLDLTRKGVLREEAYVWVQRCSMKVWNENRDFVQAVLEDAGHRARPDEEEIRAAVNPETPTPQRRRHLRPRVLGVRILKMSFLDENDIFKI